MKLTFAQLAQQIAAMTPEQQNSDVTVFVRGVDEFYPSHELKFADPKNNDVLDTGHPYLLV